MELDLGPLSQLTPLGVLTTTALIAFVDIILAFGLAAAQGKFSLSVVGEWLVSHGLKRVLPIYLLLSLGVGVSVVDIPAIPAVFALSVLGVVTYAGETIKSILVNAQDATAVHDESSVPPTV